MSYLKGDITNGAYQELRISGLTVIAGPEENKKALTKLEAMANEFFKRNVCVNYNFEDTPDLNSESNVPPEYQNAMELCLSYRLLSTFGKGQQPDPMLIKNQRAAFSYLSSSTAQVKRTQPSGRSPVGSGNTLWGQTYTRFYKPTEQAPISCATNQMVIGNIDNFVEHFDAYLNAGEAIASYTIEATTGLSILSDSLTSPDISYQIEAIGTSEENNGGVNKVKIVATTDAGRVETRLTYFELVEVDIA